MANSNELRDEVIKWREKGNELAEELHTSAFLRDGSAQEEMQSAGAPRNDLPEL